MNTLYIIGNGFDVHHGIPCRYSDFNKWLKSNCNDLFYDIEEKYGADKEWWSSFEERLGRLKTESLMDSVRDLYPDFGSDDYRDRDKFVMPDTMHYTLEYFMSQLRQAFREWIEQLPEGDAKMKMSLNKSAHFLTFNYTDTLEQLYDIPLENITHIHGRAQFDQELIVGHGMTDTEINAMVYEHPQDGLDKKELEEWYDAHYDPILEETRDNIFKAIVSIRKNTEQVIAEHYKFFSEARQARHVKVMGHSLNNIDRPYFKELIDNFVADVDWEVYWHLDGEATMFRTFLENLGVPSENITLRRW